MSRTVRVRTYAFNVVLLLSISLASISSVFAEQPFTLPQSSQSLTPAATMQNATKLYLPLVSTGTAAPPSGPSDQELIAAALKAGQINYGTSLVYRAYALFGDARLPRAYWGTGSRGDDHALFKEVAVVSPTLTLPIREQLHPFLVRPTHADSVFNTPLSVDARAVALDALPCDANGWAAQKSATVPFKVWARCTGDYTAEIAKTLGLIEPLYGPMTTLMGEPKRDLGRRDEGGSDDIDIYLLTPLQTVRRGEKEQNIAMNAFAATSDAPPYNHNKTCSGYMLLNRNRIGAPGFRTDFAHEFFHILQNAHNYEVSSRMAATGSEGELFWFDEASAEWAATHFVRDEAATHVHPLFEQHFQANKYPLHVAQPTWHAYAAYIWPFFMEQEAGPQAIANAWRAMRGLNAGDWDGQMRAIDAQLPFATRFHDFAIRNLNTSFGGTNPLGRRYMDLDTRFPDGVLPLPTEDATLTAQEQTAPPLKYTHDVLSLKAEYYHFKIDSTVKQIDFDFGKLVPLADHRVGAVLKIKGKPWELRKDLPQRLHFCLDNPDENLEEIWIVVSNHNPDLTKKVTGPIEVKPVKEPCGCSPELISKLQTVTQWQGSLRFNYGIAGSDDDLSIKQQRSVDLNVVLNTPSGDTRTFIGSPTGVGNINDQTMHNGRLQLGINGSGSPIPYDAETNEWSRVTLNFDWDTCEYNFRSSTFLNVTMTSDGDTPSQTAFDIGSLHSGRVAITGLLQSGGGSFQAHTPLYSPGADEHVYSQQDFQLMQILGEDNLGAATVSWSFKPVIPPTP